MLHIAGTEGFRPMILIVRQTFDKWFELLCSFFESTFTHFNLYKFLSMQISSFPLVIIILNELKSHF